MTFARFCFLIAAFLFLLAVFGVGSVFTLQSVGLGLFFVALGLLTGGLTVGAVKLG